jgi:hypothetical protein
MTLQLRIKQLARPCNDRRHKTQIIVLHPTSRPLHPQSLDVPVVNQGQKLGQIGTLIVSTTTFKSLTKFAFTKAGSVKTSISNRIFEIKT